MWLSFKEHGENGGNKSLLPSQSGAVAAKIGRQISRQNSNRSSGGRSGKSVIMKKIEERELNEKPGEWQRNQEYKNIRERRKLFRKHIGAKLRTIKRLYYLSLFGVLLGILFVFGATIRTLGDGTIFWTFKHQFKISGVTLIIVGVILLLVTVGLDNVSREKLKKAGIEEIKPVVHPDFLEEDPNKFRRQTSKCSYASSYDPSCPALDRQRLLWNTNKQQDYEDGFLCSSIASASSTNMPGTIPRVYSSDHWAKVMDMNLESLNNTECTGHSSFHGMPNIEITYCNEKSTSLTSKSTSEVEDIIQFSYAHSDSTQSPRNSDSKTVSSAISEPCKVAL
ncbi:uncharacterized protein LOC132738509 isoform X2 [Ruditapes philippinarum]|nr:uncharacterized protein LOC132738509 isoform X2 [Ruditapes philippinarum]XP_060581997.1 uncharacterized protein LOC132738509 isoform X2 [Ruditapes philippinarum]